MLFSWSIFNALFYFLCYPIYGGYVMSSIYDYGENYFNWLNEALDKDGIILTEHDFTKLNKKDIASVAFLYKYIDSYAKENYIYPNEFNHGDFYLLKRDEEKYRIGRVTSKEEFYFCDRALFYDDLPSLDFYDIKNNVDYEDKTTIEEKLEKLSLSVKEMLESGVPIEAIDDVVSSYKCKKRVKK